jgi:hypothetical protein
MCYLPLITGHTFSPTQALGQKSLFKNLKPLSDVQINFSQIIEKNQEKNQHENQQNVDISVLDTRSIEVLSQDPPTYDNYNQFRPFGNSMSFATPSLLSLTTQLDKNNDQIDLNTLENTTSNMSSQIQLLLDELVIGGEPGKPPQADNFGYLTHTNYKGSLMLPNGEEGTLLISITPIGDAHSEMVGNANGLETQNVDDENYIQIEMDKIAPKIEQRIEQFLNENPNFDQSQFQTLSNINTFAQTLLNKLPPFIPSDVNLLKQSNIHTTQFKSLSMDPQSGRYPHGYTIEGVIMTPTNSYYITPITTLLFQTQTLFNLNTIDYNNIREDIIQNEIELFFGQNYQDNIQNLSKLGEHFQFNFETLNSEQFASLQSLYQHSEDLSAQFTTLIDMQSEASYDLASYTSKGPFGVDSNGKVHSSCGSDHIEENTRQVNPNNNSSESSPNPLNMSPQWTHPRATPCHQRDSILTQFYIRGYASYSFSTWSSSSTTNINIAMSIARMKFYFHATSLSWSQQWGVVPALTSVFIMTTRSGDGWNAESPADSRCNNTSAMLESIAAKRSGDPNEYVSAQHFLFATCNSVGVVGVNYSPAFCRIISSAGYGSFTDASSYIILSHELGHGIDLPHPFANESQMSTFGGTMDYYRTALPDSTLDPEERRMPGFNMKTDKTYGCDYLTKIFAGSLGSGYVSPNKCYGTPNSPTQGMGTTTCGNGILDPFEECDVENTCCKNCILEPNASCDGTDPQCCTNCSPEPFTKRCNINRTGDGFCSNGTCVPHSCDTIANSEVNSCPDVNFFPPTLIDSCIYRCPNADASPSKAGSCDVVPQYSGHVVETGTVCQSNGVKGLCLPVKAFSEPDSRLRCITDPTQLNSQTYTWSINYTQRCNCGLNQDSIASITCHNRAGMIVSTSFCPPETKPIPENCQCDVYKWQYGGWSECQASECDYSVSIRDTSCALCNSSGCTALPPGETSPCLSAAMLPHNTRTCSIAPDDDKNCGNGNKNAFMCVNNPNFGKVDNAPFKVCQCLSGWGGPYCQTEPKLSDIVVSPIVPDNTLAPNTLYQGQDVELRWTYSGIPNTVTIVYFSTTTTTSTSTSLYRLIASGISATTGVLKTSIPYDMLPNNSNAATFRISIEGSNVQLSSKGLNVISFAWEPVTVGQCLGECGTATEERAINCMRSDGVLMADEQHCSSLAKPSKYQLCKHSDINCQQKMALNTQLGSLWCGYHNLCGSELLTYQTSQSTSSQSSSPQTCPIGKISSSKDTNTCDCRVVYFTLQYSAAPMTYFVDQNLQISASVRSTQDSNNNDKIYSQLTATTRRGLYEYFNIILAHYSRISEIPLGRFFIADFERIPQPQNTRILNVDLTVGVRVHCDAIDGLEDSTAFVQGLNQDDINSILSPTQTTPNPTRNTSLNLTPLDQVYVGLEKIIAALLGNDSAFRADVERYNGSAYGIIITEQSTKSNPIYDPLCSAEQLGQYNKCFSLTDPFKITAQPTDDGNMTSGYQLGIAAVLVLLALCFNF